MKAVIWRAVLLLKLRSCSGSIEACMDDYFKVMVFVTLKFFWFLMKYIFRSIYLQPIVVIQHEVLLY